MSTKYKFGDQSKPHYVTLTCIEWADVIIRNEYREIIADSLHYCQVEKGLELNAYVFMTSHLHMIIGTNQNPLQDILRDFKSYTSRHIRKCLEENSAESKRERYMRMFKYAGEQNSNNKDWQFWQQDNHPIELWDNYMIDQKKEYIHQNPVKAGFVSEPEHWLWSSAGDYAGISGPIKVLLID